jgi:hypothetical protein
MLVTTDLTLTAEKLIELLKNLRQTTREERRRSGELISPP